MPPTILTVIDRDGAKKPFNPGEMKDSIKRAMVMVDRNPKKDFDAPAERFQREVVDELQRRNNNGDPIHVERVQEVLLDVLHRDMARGTDSYFSKPEALWMRCMLDGEGHKLRQSGLLPQECVSTIPVEKVSASRSWCKKHRCGTVKDLNDWFQRGETKKLISLSENRFDEQLLDVACELDRRIDDGSLRAVLITGPTASGKTTTTKKIAKLLSFFRPDVAFKPLEMDNYFKGANANEKLVYEIDGKIVEDVNFELPESYDIDLINEHLKSLLEGRVVMVPKYDFASSTRSPGRATPFCLEEREILLIDCMHALSPQLTEAIPNGKKFKIYLEAISTLEDNAGRNVPWTDVRIMRRLIRDSRTRGHSFETTFWHWHLVRKGERFVLPYMQTADSIIDSGLPYELPILKRFIERGVQDVLPKFERNPCLFDGRERARRVLRLLSQLQTASEDQIERVPEDSILREFIGSS